MTLEQQQRRLYFAVVVALALHMLLAVVSASSDIDDNDSSSSSGVVRSIRDDLDFSADEHKLTSHYLLYTEACVGAMPSIAAADSAPYGFRYRQVEGPAALELFGDSDSRCRAACVERGVDQALAHAVMPYRIYDSSDDSSSSKNGLADFIEQGCRRVEVCLMNYLNRDENLRVYWIHPDTGDRKLHIQLGFGERETRCFSSYIGHSFVTLDADDATVIAEFTIEYTTVLGFGSLPVADDPEKHSFDAEIENTLRHEWGRHNAVKRSFSPLGFKKGRLPDDVFASMGAFFTNNRGNKVKEEWGGRGVFVNWWESDCYFIQIPWQLKGMWQERLRLLVEAWAGVPVEQTDMYGLRQYEEGARLLTHVDRTSTHAVSLIVNIAQGNLTEPWPVEVHDHADRLHEVLMAPGDIVYYESAKCLHGRNRPLTGPNAFYVNLFTHYRPTGDPAWFEKPNHENAPDPVTADVVGACRMVPTGATAATRDGQLGIVEAIRCDDPRLGPYVSPSLFTATSGSDLIDWWRSTAPPGPAVPDTASDSSAKDEL
jgi:hypothetical protein